MNLFQKIALFFKVKGLINDDIKGAKQMNGTTPGYKTTEFWLNIAAQVGTVWASVQGLIPAKYAAVISIAGAAVYTVARTVLKAVQDVKTTQAPAV